MKELRPLTCEFNSGVIGGNITGTKSGSIAFVPQKDLWLGWLSEAESGEARKELLTEDELARLGSARIVPP